MPHAVLAGCGTTPVSFQSIALATPVSYQGIALAMPKVPQNQTPL
jgi:hypothetical protein